MDPQNMCLSYILANMYGNPSISIYILVPSISRKRFLEVPACQYDLTAWRCSNINQTLQFRFARHRVARPRAMVKMYTASDMSSKVLVVEKNTKS